MRKLKRPNLGRFKPSLPQTRLDEGDKRILHKIIVFVQFATTFTVFCYFVSGGRIGVHLLLPPLFSPVLFLVFKHYYETWFKLSTPMIEASINPDVIRAARPPERKARRRQY